MKAKNILTVLGIVVVAFIYPEVTVWLVPLTVSVITLSIFRKNDIAKYIGLLSIKPNLRLIILFYVSSFGLFEQLNTNYSDEVISAIFGIVPELILTLIIVYAFRHLFKSDRLIWLFLFGDIVRWLSLFIESLIPDPFPEPYFYTQLYVWVFFLLIFPSLYAAVGFSSVRERAISEKTVY